MSGRPRQTQGRSWDWGWAVRGALVLAPFVALVAMVHAGVVLREPPVTSLVHYVAGAAYGGLLGLAAGGLLSFLRPSPARVRVRRPRRTAWVAHVHQGARTV